MGHYKRNEIQRGVKPKHGRFDFYSHHDGKANRTTRVCRNLEVEQIFQDWEDKILYGESYSLYEKFEDYLRICSSTKASYREDVYFFKLLKKFWANIDYRKITRAEVIKFRSWRLDQGLKPATVNREVAILSSFFSYLTEQDLYDKRNPCYKTKLKENNQRVIQLTPEQTREILQKSITYEISTPVMLTIFAGMRKKEVLTLKTTDIDFIHRRIHLKAKNTKSKKSRSVPMPDILYEHLYGHMDNLESRLSIKKDTLRYRWDKLSATLSFSKDLSVSILNFRDLRHVYAQMLRDCGVDLQDIQSFLGHASVTTTEARYAQTGGFNAVEKVNKIKNFFAVSPKKISH